MLETACLRSNDLWVAYLDGSDVEAEPRGLLCKHNCLRSSRIYLSRARRGPSIGSKDSVSQSTPLFDPALGPASEVWVRGSGHPSSARHLLLSTAVVQPIPQHVSAGSESQQLLSLAVSSKSSTNRADHVLIRCSFDPRSLRYSTSLESSACRHLDHKVWQGPYWSCESPSYLHAGDRTLIHSQGFYDPAKEFFIEPALTGISYSFSADGHYEEAYYRAIPNRTA